MIDRLARAIRNDLSLYPELKEDPKASSESYFVILLLALVYSLVGTTFVNFNSGFLIDTLSLATGFLAGYLVILIITWVIGVVLGGGKGSFNQVRTALAYGISPYIFTWIPVIGNFIALWALVTISTAIRETIEINKLLAYIIVFIVLIINFFITVTLFLKMISPQ